MEKKHYYLKDNRIWMANEKMPDANYTENDYEYLLKKWLYSLQPCEIGESELDKIKKHITYMYDANPIEVTDIISDNNVVITFKENKNRKTVLKEVEYLSNTDLAFFLHWFEEFRFVEDLNDFSIDDIVNQYRRDYPINKTKQVDGEIKAVEFAEWKDKLHPSKNKDCYTSNFPGHYFLKTNIELYKIFKTK